MQSMNEELQTVNVELQTKLDELSRSNNDMKNLLNSTDIATVFLDKDLHVRRFTTQAAKIIKLIPSDIGRPITDLATEMCDASLAKDARHVIKTLQPVESPVRCNDGRWFNVRVMPYRTVEDRIDGVVITLADITESKREAAILSDQHATLEKRFAKQSASMEKTRLSASQKARVGTKTKPRS